MATWMEHLLLALKNAHGNIGHLPLSKLWMLSYILQTTNNLHLLESKGIQEIDNIFTVSVNQDEEKGFQQLKRGLNKQMRLPF